MAHKQNDDDDCDYMSDAFLEQCSSVRPGLVSDRAAKALEREKKQKEADLKSKTKPLKLIEHEQREEGLGNALGTDNKGFSLLQKMGFKEGMTLGKEGNKGRKDPIPVVIKQGRGGLGREADLKRKHNQMQSYREMMKAKHAKYSVQQQKDFRQRMAGMMSEKRVHGDLMKSQRVCEQLDTEKLALEKPQEPYFWPLVVKKQSSLTEFEDEDNEAVVYTKHPQDEDEEEEEEEEEDEEYLYPEESDQLKVLTDYIRTTHFYCLWCGTTYDDADDLEDNCPGNTSEDHD